MAPSAAPATTTVSASAAPSPGTTATSTAVQALSQVSSSATTVSQIGSAVGQPALAAGANAVAQAAGALATGLAGTQAATPAVVPDPSARFETQDVYTSLGDPTGMRALVPYLLHPETWMLIKCEMTSATDKHYVFQKISTGPGRLLPEVDIFKRK
jgi:hypothetical protein